MRVLEFASLVIVLSVWSLVTNASCILGQEGIPESDVKLAEMFLDKFMNNASKCSAYAAAINHTSFKFEIDGGPLALDSEALIFVDEKEKYRRVTFRSNSINPEGSIANDVSWRTEVSRKGQSLIIDGGKEVEARSFTGFFSHLDPMETAACSHDLLRKRDCRTGFLLGVFEVPSLESVTDNGKGVTNYVIRMSPSMILELSTSEKQGGMPTQAVYKIAYNIKGAREMNPKSLRDFKFVVCRTSCKWKSWENCWFPVWVQMDRVYGKEDASPKERYEQTISWLVGEKLKKNIPLLKSVDHSSEANLFFDVLDQSVVRFDD